MATEVHLPAPLPVPPEQLVVVEIIDGIADTTLVHLPARRVLPDGVRGGATFGSFEFPPARWPSACRQVSSGSVYARAGEFADSLVCLACEEAA